MANLKGYLEDKNSNKIYPDEYDSGWIYPTLENGWTSPSADRRPAYRKVGKIVYFKGTMLSGTYKVAIFTLPVGFRPTPQYMNKPIRCGAGFGNIFINYNSIGSGIVSIENSTGTGATGQESSLLGINFIAEE